MLQIKDHGGEKNSNNFVSVAFNESDKTYHIIWNTRFKTEHNQTFKISNGYDFGALEIKDLLIDAYINPSLTTPGISRVK